MNAVMRKASVDVDTRDGATKRPGDIVSPIPSEGHRRRRDAAGHLFELRRARQKVRKSAREITLFKSGRVAIGDLRRHAGLVGLRIGP